MSNTDLKALPLYTLVRALDNGQCDPVFRDADVTYQPNAIVFGWPDDDDLSIELDLVCAVAAAYGLTARVGRERGNLWIALDSPIATNEGGAA